MAPSRCYREGLKARNRVQHDRDFELLLLTDQEALVPGKTKTIHSDPVREHELDISLVSLVNNGLRAESSLLFCLLLCQDVVLESALPLDLS